jgi:hypothetical protein
MNIENVLLDIKDENTILLPVEGFETEVGNWTLDGDRLISHRVDCNGTIYLVVGLGDKPNKCSILRFFTMGNKWATSVDYSEIDLEEAIHNLLNNID